MNTTNQIQLSVSSEEIYNSPTLTSFFHKKRVEKLVKIARTVDGQKVLEIGCDDMFLYHLLKKNYEIYVGLDVGKYGNGLSCAMQNKSNCGWQTAEVIQGQAELLPFENESFDTVFSFETIEHVDDEETTITEITRVLRPGGTLFISVPIEFGLKILLKFLLRGKGGYTFSELVKAGICCKPNKVKRSLHKGYDYRQTIKRLKNNNMKISKVLRHPFHWLPACLNQGVTILAEKY